VQAGEGAIVNIGSVVGLAPEFGATIYGATKAFVLFLSQGMSLELSPKGVYVQAVFPAATRTDIWARTGIDPDSLPELMEVEELVDAALVGFDRSEAVTIPPLHEASRWDELDGARRRALSVGAARPLIWATTPTVCWKMYQPDIHHSGRRPFPFDDARRICAGALDWTGALPGSTPSCFPVTR